MINKKWEKLREKYPQFPVGIVKDIKNPKSPVFEEFKKAETPEKKLEVLSNAFDQKHGHVPDPTIKYLTVMREFYIFEELTQEEDKVDAEHEQNLSKKISWVRK